MENQASLESFYLKSSPAPKTNFPVQHIFDSLLEVVCAIDVDGLFVYVSKASFAVWGFYPEELIGSAYIDLVVKKDRKKSELIVERLQKGEEVIFFENQYIHKKGTIVPNMWTGRWDPRDKMVYCVARDMTEMRKIESINLSYSQEIQRQGQETINILERITDGFFALDKYHNFTYWNKQAEDIMGKTREEVLGKNLWDCYPDIEDTQFEMEYKKSAEEKLTSQYQAYFGPMNTWYEVSSYPSDSGVSVFFKDINERKKKEDECEELSLLAKETADAVIIDGEKKKQTFRRKGIYTYQKRKSRFK